MSRARILYKIKSSAILALMGTTAFAGINLYKSNEKFYADYVMPVVHLLDAERAHQVGVMVNKYKLLPKSRYRDPEVLNVSLFGLNLSNPVGLAAGFDKNAEAMEGLLDSGFGFVEVGSVTPLPQPGNEKPRVFRLKEDGGVINRYGFNSDGHDVVYKRMEELQNTRGSSIVGVNLGKNKTSTDAVADYAMGIKKFSGVCKYLVINISSPNTPGLRNLQAKLELEHLLTSVVAVKNSLPESSRPPLFLKLSPDLAQHEKEDIADVLKDPKCQVDGLIISNTTLQRPDLNDANMNEGGGLSGVPLKDLATNTIKDMYRLTNGMPIIGVGGISSGKDAYEKIRAGACLVQLYTCMVYGGPPVVTKVKRELANLLETDGFHNVAEAVGIDARK